MELGHGNGLHHLQVDISMRGIALLKVGGRMVYSTCSMNPVENEAVVAEVLRRCGNSVELLDVSNELPELVRRPGLSTWKLQDRGSWFQTHEDLPHNRKNAILPSMFPSSKSTQESHTVCGDVEVNIENNGSFLRNCNIEETNNINCDMAQSLDSSLNFKDSSFALHRCMRIVPHDQNSGAFFIAVLHKVSPLNDSKKELEPEIGPSENISVHQQCIVSEVADGAKLLESGQAESGDGLKSQNESRWKGVDPVLFLEDEVVIKSIVSFFGIKESFRLKGHLVTRSAHTNNARRIYYISKSVQQILQLNLEVGEQLKIASLGLKMFETHRSKDGCSCPYRLSYEGLPLLLPYVSKRILYASPVDFHLLLQYRTISFAHFVGARLGEEAAFLTPVCCVVVLHDEGHENAHSISIDPSTIAIVCWRGKGTMNVMVSPPDRKELLERIEYRFRFKAAIEEDER